MRKEIAIAPMCRVAAECRIEEENHFGSVARPTGTESGKVIYQQQPSGNT